MHRLTIGALAPATALVTSGAATAQRPAIAFVAAASGIVLGWASECAAGTRSRSSRRR